MKNKVLFIAYEMPPRWGPHALRIAYFCKYLHEYGWDVGAIGCAPWDGYEDYTLAEKIPFDVCVVRIPQEKTGLLSSAIWTWRAVREGLRLIRKDRPDILLTSAPQYISHMAGFIISLLTKIPWVADYGDPFTHHAAYRRNRLNQSLVYTLEKAWLKQASRIILVTKEAKEHYDNVFPMKQGKCEWIPLGYDPEDHKYFRSDKIDSKFRIAFAGSLHQVMSEGPKEFFKGVVSACRQSEKFRNETVIDIISRENAELLMQEVVPKELHGILKFHGHLSKMSDLFGFLSSASCFVAWGFRGGLQLPSKIYIYFGLKKPILGIMCDSIDPMRDILEDNRRGLVVNNSETEIALGLMQLFEIHQSGQARMRFNLRDIEEFTWPKLTQSLDAVLKETVSKADNDGD